MEVPASLGRLGRSVSTSSRRLDCAVVEILGTLAGAVAAALVLRNLRGTSTPYGLPVALALLKLPVGALSAVLGILVVRAGLLIGFPDISTPSQILALALVFGFFGQLIFTRPVDQIGVKLAAGDPESSMRAFAVTRAYLYQLTRRFG